MRIKIKNSYALNTEDPAMTFELPTHIQENIAETRTEYAGRHIMFVTLSNAGLATLFRMRRCRTPKHAGCGIPVYDSAFWHIIVPETIRHLPPDRDNRNPHTTLSTDTERAADSRLSQMSRFRLHKRKENIMTDGLTLTRALESSGMQSAAAERVATRIYDAIHENVATKTDVQQSEAALRGDLTALRGDLQRVEATLKADLEGRDAALSGDLQRVYAQLRADLQRVEAGLKAEFTNLRTDTGTYIANLRTDMLRLVIAAASAVTGILTAIHYFVPVTFAH